MSKKVVVTLRSGPSVSIEVPGGVKRSCFGAIRLFPGIPKAIAMEEFEYVREKHPMVRARLEVGKYVESKRVGARGISEADLEGLAEREGLSHLKLKMQVEKLRERGKLPISKFSDEGKSKRTTRRIRNGNGNSSNSGNGSGK